MKKLGFTAYGKIGSDAIRTSIAILEDGSFAFVREDGSNAVLPDIPTSFVTCGTASKNASRLGYAVNMATMTWAEASKGHDWKGRVTMKELATRESFTNWTNAQYKAVRDGLLVSYELLSDPDELQIAA